MSTIDELIEKWGFVDVDGELQSPNGEIYSILSVEYDGDDYYHEHTFWYKGMSFTADQIIELLEQHKEEQENG